MPPISVKVTSNVVGTSLIIPFNYTEGLQMYPAGHSKAGQPVIYRINKYEMVVDASKSYHVVRFGLQNNGKIPASRISDAGLTAPRTVHPSWVPGYSPHSFQGGPYAGAWRIPHTTPPSLNFSCATSLVPLLTPTPESSFT